MPKKKEALPPVEEEEDKKLVTEQTEEEDKKLITSEEIEDEDDDFEEDFDEDEDDEDLEVALEKIFGRKKEGLKMARIYREVEVQPSNPTTVPPMADNPVGNVPGEGKYVSMEAFDDRCGKLEEGVRMIGKEVSRMRKSMEGAGEVKDPAMSPGPDAPRTMPERLEGRKTIVGNQPMKETLDIKKSVKEFLRTQGGMM